MCLANKALKRTRFLREALCFRINFRLHPENDWVECRLSWKFLVGSALSSGAVVGETFSSQKLCLSFQFFSSSPANHKANERRTKRGKFQAAGELWLMMNYCKLNRFEKKNSFYQNYFLVNFYFSDIFMGVDLEVKRFCVELFCNWALNNWKKLWIK